MQYMLVVTETAEDYALRTNPEKADSYWGGWAAYVKAIAESGIMVSGAGLQPPDTATTVRIRQGNREVQDGPYADTRETLAGYFVIEVPTLDDALAWAARSPSASTASVEVRPVLPPMN